MTIKRRVLMSLIAVATASLMTACSAFMNTVTGSGSVVSQTYDYSDFNHVSVSHAFRATISQGVPYSVEVRVDDNIVDLLDVRQVDETLHVGLTGRTLVRGGTLELIITMPNLAGLSGSSGSQIQLNPFESGDNFTGSFSGAGRLHGDLDAADIELDVSAGGAVFLAGSASNVTASASGGSTIDLTELEAIDADLKAGGGSTITVNVDGLIDAAASGGSNIYYLGDPELGHITTSGGSNVGPR